MAQIIKHRRGSLEALSAATSSFQKGELIIVSGSSNITSVNGSGMVFAAVESGSIQAVNRFLVGDNAPNTFPANQYNGLLKGVPYYASGSSTLYLLGSGGNDAINLVGNIQPFSQSIDSRVGSLEASLGGGGSIGSRVAALETSSANINSFTSSQLTQNSNLASYTGSVNTRLTEIGVVSGSLIASASVAAVSITNLNASSASQQVSIDNLNTFSSSVNTKMTEIGVVSGSLISSASAASVSISNINSFTSSFSASVATDFSASAASVAALSASVASVTGDFSSSVATSFSASNAARVALSQSVSASFAGVAVEQAAQDTKINGLSAFTGSYATTGSNIFYGTQTITGSVYITANLVVQGSSSLQNITASAVDIGTNVVKLNTASPAVRFGGISVYDSGSSQSTGSLFWDSLNNVWLYENPSGSAYVSARLISGPQNSGSLGNEAGLTAGKLVIAVGDDHIADSIVTQAADNSKITVGGGLDVTGNISGSIVGIGNVTSFSSSVDSRLDSIEGSLGGGGSIGTRVSALESFTGSQLTENSSLATITGSLITTASNNVVSITNLNSFSSSVLTQLSALGTETASIETRLGTIQTLTSSYNSQFSAIGTETASLETRAATLSTYTASLNTQLSAIGTETASLETRAETLATLTSSYNSQLSAIGTETASLETRATAIATITGSLITTASNNVVSITNLNSFSSSAIVRLSNLETTSASVNTSISNINLKTGSYATTGSNTFVGLQTINNQLIIGNGTTGSNENTLVVGVPLAGGPGEGGQILLAASGGLYTSASMLDVYQNKFRILRGTNEASDGHKFQIDLGTGQLILTNYTSGTSFTGSVATYLAVDSSGNVITSTPITDVSALNSFTASATTRLNNLETTSASVNVSVSNLNSFSSSQLTQNSTLATYTSSLETRMGAIATETASIETRLTQIGVVSGSLIATASNHETRVVALESTASYLQGTFSTSVDSRLDTIEASIGGGGSLSSRVDALETSSANLNSFSSSILTQMTAVATVTGSLISSASAAAIADANQNSFTASANTRLSNLETTSASVNTSLFNINSFTESADVRLDNLELKSASVDTSVYNINSFTASANTRLSNLESTSASVNTSIYNINGTTASLNTSVSNLNSTTASLNTSVAALNSYSSALKTAIELTGSSVTILGDLTVKGTTTAVESTTVQLGDNIIELNGTGAANAGLLVKDPTAPNTVSGSLLWDSTNDYWKAGALGAESKLLRQWGDSVVSGSSQIDVTATTNYSIITGQFSAIGTVTGSLISSASAAKTTNDAQDVSISNLNSFTSSINTTIKDKLNVEGVVSGSSQITLSNTTGYSTFSSSIATDFSASAASVSALSASVASVTGDFSASVATSFSASNASIVALSASVASVTGDFSASVAQTFVTQSQRIGSLEALTGSFATTGSNTFRGNEIISGNVVLANGGQIRVESNTASTLFGMYDGNNILGSYYQMWGNNHANADQRGTAEFVYDTRNGGGAFHIAEFDGNTWVRKFSVANAGATITGSLNVSGEISGSTLNGVGNVTAFSASIASQFATIDGGTY